MTMGQAAYFGSAADSLGHFARLGLEPTGLMNPADYLLEVHISSDQKENSTRRSIVVDTVGRKHVKPISVAQ